MQQYLTYQHNVQKFFKLHSEKYDGVIIPLSIATSFPSGTYGFIRALCSRHKDVQYAIDPRNAMFQKDWNRANARPPHQKMAAALGRPYISHGLSRPLTPGDFGDDQTLCKTVMHCIKFQRKFRTRGEDERKLKKYMDLLGLDSLDPLKEPQHLIPPYFQFQQVGDPWYEVSLRSTAASNKYAKAIPLRPVLHFHRWRDAGNWALCFRQLLGMGISKHWLYPNDFREHEADTGELGIYRKTVRDSVVAGLEPFALFGGYFAALLSYDGLVGFGNGVGYGEWRDSSYHRGGTANLRLYSLKLHRYIDAVAAQNLIDKDAEYFGGDSDIVASYVEAGQSLLDISSAESLDHFMDCRYQELEYLKSHTREDAIAELDETVLRLKDLGPLEHDKYGPSLKRWIEVLR